MQPSNDSLKELQASNKELIRLRIKLANFSVNDRGRSSHIRLKMMLEKENRQECERDWVCGDDDDKRILNPSSWRVEVGRTVDR